MLDKELDRDFIVDVFGEKALLKKCICEGDRIFILDPNVSEAEIKNEFEENYSKSVFDMPFPPLPNGELSELLFTMPDGTEVTWIKHPAALPEECRAHWKDHILHFQFANNKIGYEAHHSVHRLAVVEAHDGLPRIFAPGGIRWVDYKRREDMISDALDMSIAVSMKIEVVHTPCAGSKIAVRADKSKKNEILASLYAAVEKMGLAITAADLGLSAEELNEAAVPVAPTSSVPLGVYKDGLPSSFVTACGVQEGLAAMIDTLPQKDHPENITISVQGLGEVGYELATRLIQRKIRLIVAEINPDTVKKFTEQFKTNIENGQVTVLRDPSAIFDQKADIFCPCALRSILNEETLPRFVKAGVKMIGGPANNIFNDQKNGPWLFQNAGIVVIPYEGIGAGGVTGVAQAIMTGIFGKCPFDYRDKVKVIAKYVQKIIKYAQKYNLPAQVISDRILINSLNRRTFIGYDRAFALMTEFAEAYRIGGAYEKTFIEKMTKNGFFFGHGKYPEGGWKYLTTLQKKEQL